MIPRRLSIHGVTRFSARVDLDLSTLPSGLVAVTGPNGAGKSTIFEALCPAALWLEMPSRPGPLWQHLCQRDGLLDMEHDYAGHRWRHLVQCDGGTDRSPGKVEALLYRDGESLTPGRVRDYEEAVALYFPPRDLVLASVFSAQGGGGSFARLPVAGRRALFADLLGLDELQTLADRSTRHRKGLDAAILALEPVDGRLCEDEATSAELAATIATLGATVRDQEREADELRGRVDAAVAAHASAEGQIAYLETARRGAEEARSRVAQRRSRVSLELSDARTALARDEALAGVLLGHRATLAAQVAGEARRVELRHEYAKVQGRVAVANAAVTSARGDVERAARDRLALEAAAARSSAASDVIARLQSVEDDAARLDGEIVVLRANRLAALDARATLPDNADVDYARLHVRQATIAANRIDEVPCGGRVLDNVDCGSCALLADAVIGRDQLPALTAALAAAVALDAQIKAADLDMATVRAALRTAEEARRACDPALRSLIEARVVQMVDPVALANAVASELAVRPALARLVDVASTLTKELEEVADQGRTTAASLDSRGADGLQALVREAEAADARLETLRASVARLAADFAEAVRDEEALAPVPVVDRSVVVAAAEAVAAARASLAACSDEAGRRRGQREAVLLQQARLGDLPARRAALVAARDGSARGRNAFRHLETALGERGVQALEIDAAGPTVSALTNDLLDACYGGRFRVVLRTVQEAEAGRKQREVFDARVLDGERGGGPRDVGELSGGEQVLVEEALKLGIALFRAQRVGTGWGTLWRDECDGRLDPLNASRFPSLLRKALELGGFERCYFVSHRPDVIEQADARIVVGADGAVEVRGGW